MKRRNIRKSGWLKGASLGAALTWNSFFGCGNNTIGPKVEEYTDIPLDPIETVDSFQDERSQAFEEAGNILEGKFNPDERRNSKPVLAQMKNPRASKLAGRATIWINNPSNSIYPVFSAETNPDTNLNGKIDFDDFIAFAKSYGNSNPRFDFDKSGEVDFGDFTFFASNVWQHPVDSVPEVSSLPSRTLPQVGPDNTGSIDLAKHVTDIYNKPFNIKITDVRNLKTSLEGSVLTYEPFGMNNTTDNGVSTVTFQVEKQGLQDSPTGNLEVDVKKDLEAMQLYNEVTNNETRSRWIQAPTEAIIFTGPGLKNGTLSGPVPTAERIQDVEDAYKTFFKLTGFPENIRKTNNPDDVYHPEKSTQKYRTEGKLVWIENDGILPSMGLTGTYDNKRNKTINAVTNFTAIDASRRTVFHEIIGHGIGLDHPEDSPRTFKAEDTLFSQGSSNNLVYRGIDYTQQGYTPRDEFIIKSHTQN